MKPNQTPTEVLDHLLTIYKGYSEEHRATTQPFHLARTQQHNPTYQFHPDDLIIREPLIEHTGSLPIVATAIHPFINDASVDLGKALIMLAVHDIGELGVGDDMTFTKGVENAEQEREYALNNLHESLHPYYVDIEEKLTTTGKFAKAIDAITPDIVDLLTPAAITIKRYKHFTNKQPNEIVPLVKQFKHPYMLWNEFMTAFHLELLARLDAKIQQHVVENG